MKKISLLIFMILIGVPAFAGGYVIRDDNNFIGNSVSSNYVTANISNSQLASNDVEIVNSANIGGGVISAADISFPITVNATEAVFSSRQAAVSLYKLSHVTAATATEIVVTFDTEVYDPMDMHKSDDPSITINVTGIYYIHAQGSWTDNVLGVRSIQILLNGGTYHGRSYGPSVAGDRYNASASCVLSLSAGDYLQVVMNQTTGTDLDIREGTSGTRFELFKLN